MSEEDSHDMIDISEPVRLVKFHSSQPKSNDSSVNSGK